MGSFRYGKIKKQSTKDYSVRYNQPKTQENLRGEVDGIPASDLEERAHKAIRGVVRVYSEPQVAIPGNIPGQDKQLDVLAYTVPPTPINIDGFIGHHTAEQRGEDSFRDWIINDFGMKQGWNFVQSWREYDLDTQDQADAKARRELG